MDEVKYDDLDEVYWGKSIYESSRPHGPCTIYTDGTVVFSSKQDNGSICRENGPAKIYPEGAIVYYGEYGPHRTTGPACILANGKRQYFVDNVELTQLEFFATYGAV